MNNKKLYHFLMNNECHLFRKENGIIAWVVVNFFDLSDFVKIIGSEHFSDGGLEVEMMESYIAIELNGIIEGDGEDLGDYKECFGSEWNEYFDKVNNHISTDQSKPIHILAYQMKNDSFKTPKEFTDILVNGGERE